MKRKKASPRFVVCVKNDGFPASLELRKLYEVLPDADAERRGFLRIVDEDGEDYLYPRKCFVAVEMRARDAATIPPSG